MACKTYMQLLLTTRWRYYLAVLARLDNKIPDIAMYFSAATPTKRCDLAEPWLAVRVLF